MGAGVEAVIARGAPDCTFYLYFRELRTETVRKGPGEPEMRAHKVPIPACSARFGPDIPTKYTPGASLAPLFGQFPDVVRRIRLLRTRLTALFLVYTCRY